MATAMSSRWTPFYKFVLPVLVVGGMCFGAVRASLQPQDVHMPPGMAPDYGWVALLAMLVLVTGVMWYTLAPLKKVELDGDDLVISNYRTEIRVPLDMVEKIDERSMTNPRRYRMTFREPTDFGRRIVFLEPMAWTLNPWHECEEVAELRRAVADAQMKVRRG
ncbi:MAG: hypothetical protein ACYC3L_16750 [Gemmatimonadaceae bacterium]